VFLLNDVVAPDCGDHLLVVDVSQAGNLSDRGSVTPELIGMDDLWDVVFSEHPGQEGLRSLGVAVPLKQDIEHEPVLVNCSPEPMSDAVDARTDLVEMPPGTPSGFPMAEVFREKGFEVDAPLAQGFVADLNAALVQQFLDVPGAQWETVVQPLWAYWMMSMGETVAVGLGVGHGQSA